MSENLRPRKCIFPCLAGDRERTELVDHSQVTQFLLGGTMGMKKRLDANR